MDWVQFLILFITLVGFRYTFTKQTKDSHERLCKLEERYQNLMERWLESRK